MTVHPFKNVKTFLVDKIPAVVLKYPLIINEKQRITGYAEQR